MKKLIYMLLLTFTVSGSMAYAQETDVTGPEQKTEEETAEKNPYLYPKIAPELSIFGGYWYEHVHGSPRAEQYEYPHDSLSLGGELRMFSFPNRFYLDLDIKNSNDYFGNLSYAYEDLVLLQVENRTLFHNLVNRRLAFGSDLGLPDPFSAGFLALDGPDVQYGIKTGISTFSLRLKAPDYPFHLYAEGMLVTRDGTRQQIDLLGSGFFDEPARVSQSRNIDSTTKNAVVGANSHFGPIEVDISHGEKRFDVSADKVLYDQFTQSFFIDPSVAQATGVYPHNAFPEFKSSSNTIKLHTSYTGSLVASTTFSQTNNTNRDSGATADYFVGAGEVSWVASTNLTAFVKYRHTEIDVDNPAFVSITDITNPANTYTFSVKPSLSSVYDLISGTVRYRPVKGLSLVGEYSFENIRRDHAADWGMPDATQNSTESISASLRVIQGLDLKAKYTHKDIHDPSTNIQPNHSDDGKISISWIPLPRINTLVTYALAKERSHDLLFLDENGNPIPGPQNRNVTRENLLASITFVVLKDLSLTASYDNMRNKIRQDIAFSDDSGNPLIDSNVPYTNMAQCYALDINYMPKQNINLNAGVSRTNSTGNFYPDDINLTQPVSIASFSALSERETSFSASGQYRFKGGISTGINYRFSRISDVLNNPTGDVQDGRVHIILLTISKRW